MAGINNDQTNKIKANQKSNCYTSECVVCSIMFLAHVWKSL